MKEILIIIGIIFAYVFIGEFLYGLSNDSMSDDILGEIVWMMLWPVWIMMVVSLWIMFRVVDPIIGHPIRFAKNLGRKLGEKIWRK